MSGEKGHSRSDNTFQFHSQAKARVKLGSSSLCFGFSAMKNPRGLLHELFSRFFLSFKAGARHPKGEIVFVRVFSLRSEAVT